MPRWVKLFDAWLPGPELVLQALNFLISFGVITGLFAMMFKILPDACISWSDVWVGAAMTSLLFTIGKFLIGLYLGKSDVGSAYGAAGSLVIILVWVYYSAQILLFGAEFTQVYANKAGSRVVPTENAVAVNNKAEGGRFGTPVEAGRSQNVPPQRWVALRLAREAQKMAPFPRFLIESTIAGLFLAFVVRRYPLLLGNRNGSWQRHQV